MKKMLVIPGGFVPYNDPVTLLCYKHLRLLPCQMDVIALKGKEDTTLAQELKKDSNYSKFNIEYICNYDDAVATFERKNIISGVFNIYKYIRSCIKKFNSNDYDYIYSSSVPCFTHLAAYFIKKKKPQVKWIASFSDPLKKSPYKYDRESFKEYSIIAKIGFLVYVFIYMNGLYESIAMKHADKIIYICEEQEQFMIANHPKIKNLHDKSIIIPLNYIDSWDMYQNLINTDQKPIASYPITMGHFGRVYGLRKIDKFIDALHQINTELNGKLSEKLHIVQYGQLLDRYRNQIAKYNLEDVFSISEKIPYSNAIDAMKACDILVIFDTIVAHDQYQPYIPSKTLEYLLLKKPIYVLSCEKSPIHRIGKEFNCLYTSNDVTEIKSMIYKLINLEFDQKQGYYQQFENKVCIQTLLKYIQQPK